jgi:IclR family acetate operon transcriptional repressor
LEVHVIEARVQSVARAAALLEAMASGEWVALRDLARRIGVAKTTAFNLVGALVDVGLVEHDPANGHYRLGLLHLVYGRAVERRMDMVELIRPYLVRLCAETRETVNLALPCTTDVIIVESLESNQALRVSSYAGTRAEYHATACGRALIAWRSDAFRQTIFDLGPLRPKTSRTTTDLTALNALLDRCRAQGWTSEFEENEIGSACVAAPIFDVQGQPMASVSIAGPASRFEAPTMHRLGTLLVQRMTEISAALQRATQTPELQRRAEG